MNNALEAEQPDVVDYCANPDCSAEIRIGQPAYKIGHELVCSGACLIKRLGAKPVIAGREAAAQ